MRLFLRLTEVVYAVAWVVAAVRLPDRVPLHFGPGGGVDHWGSRAEALVTFAVLGVAMAALFEVLPALFRRWGLRPAWVNLPHKAWWTATPEREAEAQRRLAGDMSVIGGLVMILLSAMVLLTVRAAGMPAPGFGVAGWWLVGGFLAAVLGWTVWMMTGRYRPEEDR